MEVKKLSINGNEFIFVNEYGKTRKGFKHTSTLFEVVNGNCFCVSIGKCYYQMRTWEMYKYRASMKTAALKARDERKKAVTDDYREANNLFVLTKKNREELEKVLNSDALINDYNALYNAL